jgi:hypothetical protein
MMKLLNLQTEPGRTPAHVNGRPPLCRAFLLAAVALAVMGGLTGCIRSKVTITSDPIGAEVIWRGEPYGATPVTIPFIWYWHYDVALEKPGFKRLEATERFRTPPWFLMPLDLLMEIIPVPIQDHRERHYTMTRLETGEIPPPPRETVLTPESAPAVKPKAQ